MILQYWGYRISYTSQHISSSFSLDYLYESGSEKWDTIARDCPMDKNLMCSAFLIANRNSKGKGDLKPLHLVWCYLSGWPHYDRQLHPKGRSAEVILAGFQYQIQVNKNLAFLFLTSR